MSLLKKEKVKKSSKEDLSVKDIEMPRLLQTTENFTGCRSVVHLHSTHIVAAIHREFDLQKIASEFPGVSRYTKVAPTVKQLPAVSIELASGVNP